MRGGSRAYVEQARRALPPPHPLAYAVAGVQAHAQRTSACVTRRGEVEHFDAVVLACHCGSGARASCRIRAPPRREILGAFRYQQNEVLLHTDTRMLPRNAAARARPGIITRSSASQDGVALTYDMNVLMSLDAPVKFLVSLNRSADIEPSQRAARASPTAIRCTRRAPSRRRSRRAEISGVNRTFYCGAYWGFGFHEDGLHERLSARPTRSAATRDTASRAAGALRMKSCLYTGWVQHHRRGPRPHRFPPAALHDADRSLRAAARSSTASGSGPRAGPRLPGSAARTITAILRCRSMRPCATWSQTRDRRAAAWPDPPAHAPALLRAQLQSGELLLRATTRAMRASRPSSPRSPIRPGASGMRTCCR